MNTSIIEKINHFYEINAQETPEAIFSVLKDIIPFANGYIYLSDRLEYSVEPEQKEQANELTSELKIKNSPFGKLKITRDKEFSDDEEVVFQTCSSVIANLIKDIELSKIINMQVKALQDGIAETSEAYHTEKSKNDFFANFSHELRTPLNSIISSSELLGEEIFGKLNDKQAEYISDIRIAGLHLLGMINDILDMAKLESKSMQLNLTEFELSQVCNEALNIVKPMAKKKNIKISTIYKPDTLIKADYSKIQQILFNLLSNAIKYTPENGKIKITTHKNKKHIIEIKDNGIGIPVKYHKKIFEKFTQLGSAKNSNGLGLTITKELIKLHNGNIKVESKLGKGAKFIVELP